MYELVFVDDDNGRQRYEMSFQAVAAAQKQIPIEQWDDVVELVRKLKSIGKPAIQKLGNRPLFDLQDDGGTIHLDKGEMKVLIDLIKQPIWLPLALEDVQDLLGWLEKIPKVPGVPLRQEIKRAAKEATSGEKSG